MAPWVIVLLICLLYLIIVLIMGIIPGKMVSGSVAGYVAADGSMNTLVLYFVLGASVFSSFAFLGGPGWAYSRGAAAFYIIAYGTIGMIPLYFLGPHARRVGKRFDFVTQAEILTHRYNSDLLSVLLAILSVVAFVPYLTLQMKGAGYILATVSNNNIPVWLGALFCYGVVVIYVLKSGVMGVGWTNTFQGIFMMIIAWFLGIYLPHILYGGIGNMFNQITSNGLGDMLRAPGLAADGKSWSWWGYSSAVLVSGIGLSMWPHLFMKSYAANSKRSLRLTVVLYPTFQLFLVPILLIGFSAILKFPGIKPADTIVPYLLTQLSLSPILVGLVCAGVLAASMSSGDAILHAAASIGIRDGVKKLLPHSIDDSKERRWIRIMVVLISVLAYYFAVFSKVSIVSLLLGAYGGVAQIFPLMFATFYWPRSTKAGALSGLTVGILVNTFFLLMPNLKPVPMHEGIYGLIANVIMLITVSLLTKPEPIEKLRIYSDNKLNS